MNLKRQSFFLIRNNMASFATAMNASATTWNGAASLSTPDVTSEINGRLSLMFKSTRGLSTPALYELMKKSASEDVVDAFVLAFHIRDIRDGKGERDLGRMALRWLLVNYPVEFDKIHTLIPEYGRWDDMLQFFPNVLDLNTLVEFGMTDTDKIASVQHAQMSTVSEFARQLQEDKNAMSEGYPCSLAAKWAPTEKDSLDRTFGVVDTLAKSMYIRPRDYRKTVTTPLRSYINVVEKLMCDNRWDEIDFSKVPSVAMKRLKKAFEKHEPERFSAWRDKLSTGEGGVKVNSAVLFPYELIRELERTRTHNPVSDAQWNVIEQKVISIGSLKDTIAVVDTSASMSGLPMWVAISLGLLVAATSTGDFSNHLITFHENPSFKVIKPGTLLERYEQVASMGWGGSTNLLSTFKLILHRGLIHKLPQEAMPKKLMIISDMQFNIADRNFETNFEAIERMYKESGYIRPQIVFWNVSGDSTDYPVSSGDHGTAMISGASPSVMKQVLEGGGDFTPRSVLVDLLGSDRYSKVRTALTN
jgi:hypothetical protein